MLQNFNLGETERVSVIKNCLGNEGLQLIAALIRHCGNGIMIVSCL